MFPDADHPRLFGLPPGVDFPRALVAGLKARMGDAPPEALARVTLVVNTARMRRRIRSILETQGPVLMPRIRLVTEFGYGPAAADIPAPVSPLRRRFELTRLIAALLERQPDLAPQASLFDLADSLASLIEEMGGEGVTPAAIAALDVSDLSGHWERAKAFFAIADAYISDAERAPDPSARQRQVVERLVAHWQDAPPQDPIIVAGSTGSRGTTAFLMQAVSMLPQGAVVLPGFDFDTPQPVWSALDGALPHEDHPQYRFARLADDLGVAPTRVRPWTEEMPPSPSRNALVSLALRPAPVTDQWLSEGPDLKDLQGATTDVTLVEAASMREEAMAIALRLRSAAQTGQMAALISPDRMLTRQVAAALDRWDIVPDDSAGLPLNLSPPGRLMRHTAGLLVRPLTAEALLTLLKHPLCHSGGARGDHLRLTRTLELHIRHQGIALPTADALNNWAAKNADERQAWVDWIVVTFCNRERAEKRPFKDWLSVHLDLSASVAQGEDEGSGGLYDAAAGREMAAQVADMQDNAQFAGDMTAADYVAVFESVIAAAEVRDRDRGHPGILIWGTLEARVQGADLVILGGLNEGSWPEAPAPDPWLNRRMRHDAGLLLPERRIGLSAHDFQQAIAAKEVWLTRSIRSDESETVPSRWLNRLTNLLKGLPEIGGRDALNAMQNRGQRALALVKAFEDPPVLDAAKRPAPRPPIAARPREMSVTQVKTLIRDPYALYARRVLRLKDMPPLMKMPDALMRGIVVHEVLERFIVGSVESPERLTADELIRISETVLAESVPWPTARIEWLARLTQVADPFLAGESLRRARATPAKHEVWIAANLEDPPFRLFGKADRVDVTGDGRYILYDYKTGSPPSAKDQRNFDKQLLLEAAIAEIAGIDDLPPAPVADAVYVGLGRPPRDVPAPLEDTPTPQVWDEFRQLVTAYGDPSQGFVSRRAMQRDSDPGDYDHLARLGEWDPTDPPVPEDLT